MGNKVNAFYGWKPDVPDWRDFQHSVSAKVKLRTLPDKFILPNLPRVFNQGSLGSCVSNAVAGAHIYSQVNRMKDESPILPARLFIYYNTRKLEGTINEDSGSSIRNGVKSIAQWGTCDERCWPYAVTRFKDKPSRDCYLEGLNHQALVYKRVNQKEIDIKATLVDGFPIVFGFAVYTSFEGSKIAKDGILNLPSRKERLVGGHAVLVVGYDDKKKSFLIRNSWGPDWGLEGNFYMPYDYLLNPKFASDFWIIETVETT